MLAKLHVIRGSNKRYLQMTNGIENKHAKAAVPGVESSLCILMPPLGRGKVSSGGLPAGQLFATDKNSFATMFVGRAVASVVAKLKKAPEKKYYL